MPKLPLNHDGMLLTAVQTRQRYGNVTEMRSTGGSGLRSSAFLSQSALIRENISDCLSCRNGSADRPVQRQPETKRDAAESVNSGRLRSGLQLGSVEETYGKAMNTQLLKSLQACVSTPPQLGV